MFVLSKNGQRSLDVEVSSHGDPSIKIADLEDSRREIISLSGVPAPYLGYMDVVELREQLVHTNTSFATEITDFQETISDGLNKIIDRIAVLTKNENKPSEFVEISLIPPVVLILQLVETTLSSVGNIGGVFQQMQMKFDPYMFLKNYVPYIDWETFKINADKYDIETKTKNKLATDGEGEGGSY